MQHSPEAFVKIEDLHVHYPASSGLFGRARTIKAVDGVSLEISRGETLGLVGESGCGKSTLGRAILRLTGLTGGKVIIDGTDVAALPASAMRRMRRRMQMIFQDPFGSLNPRMTAAEIVKEPLIAFGKGRGAAADGRVKELLETVGLSGGLFDKLPHQFSGGQRQRIGLARALAAEPDLIVADEPISALDVSIQAQIINLLQRLQVEKKLTYLFISHDLRAVRHLANRVAVMYLGRIVELGGSREVYEMPLMPYTRALISAIPTPDPEGEAGRSRIVLKGDMPSPLDPPKGCPFNPRCPYVIEECRRVTPQLAEIRPGHLAACVRISRSRPDIEANAANGLRPDEIQ